MGSRTPEHDGQGHHGDSSNANGACRVGGEPRGSHTSRDGDGCLGDMGGDDDSDDDGHGEETSLAKLDGPTTNDGAEAPKKRKKSKSKKKKRTAKTPLKQSSPPRVPVGDLFPSGEYSKGEVQFYTRTMTSTEEARHTTRRDLQDEHFLQNYRKAAEVHRQARQWAQETVKPGQTLLSVAEGIEDSVRALLGHAGLETGDSLKAGMGFPTGLCLNHQTAHYTPNPGQKDVVLQYQDVMKVDYGVHVNGWIVDSAFTMTFDPTYDDLLAAVKDATNSGIKAAGIDVRICDISEAIQEAMESYEVEIRGKTFPVKAVRNITAHDIKRYRIHGGKSIPFVKNSDQTKLEEGEIIAIETFGTTGLGWLRDDAGIYGYGLNYDAPMTSSSQLASARRLHKTIKENFGTLVFCRRYLERLGVERYLLGMKSLVSSGIVDEYRPLADVEGSYTAQFEHTLILHENHKEVVSRGDDY